MNSLYETPPESNFIGDVEREKRKSNFSSEPRSQESNNFIKEYATPLSILFAGVLIAVGAYNGLSGRTADTGSGTGTRVADFEVAGARGDDHIRGSKDAEVLMVEFSDTECPFCRSFDQTAKQVVAKYAESAGAAWVYRHFPIASLHPKAQKESEAMECAAEQKGNDGFWAFSDKLYAMTRSNNSLDIGVYNQPEQVPTNPQTGEPYYTEKAPRYANDAGKLTDIALEIGLDRDAFEECLSGGRFAERVKRDVDEAAAAGAGGTPFIVFVSKDKVSKDTRALLDSFIQEVGPNAFVISKNGRQISMSGALPYTYIERIIDSLLK